MALAANRFCSAVFTEETSYSPTQDYSPRASATYLLKNVMGQEKTGESVMEKILFS
jgi:hypothetical protein